jgi:outer membrane murein-binding lipoprotein Lpp
MKKLLTVAAVLAALLMTGCGMSKADKAKMDAQEKKISELQNKVGDLQKTVSDLNSKTQTPAPAPIPAPGGKKTGSTTPGAKK